MSRCAWVIHERGDRWARAVDRFGPAMHPAGYTVERGSSREKLSAGPSTASRPVVVLYELSAEGSSEVLRTVAEQAAEPTPPLQIVVLAAELTLADPDQAELVAALRGLGAAAVLSHPEQLPEIARLVQRYVGLATVPHRRRL